MKISFVAALAAAIHRAATTDPNVILIGNGFGGLSMAAREAFAPVFRDFGDRVQETPISELGLAGAGIGAALAGCRPLVDLSTGSFIFQAFAQVVNEAPNIHYMTGGQSRVPVTFYSLGGIRGAGAAQHSHRTQAMLANVPGLQILLPGSPLDAYQLMLWSLTRSQNPTIFLSHPVLFDTIEEVDLQAPILPPGQVRVCRTGDDVTIVTNSVLVSRSLEAAAGLEREHGISAEVVDLRSLAPLDREGMVRSAVKTGRVVVADECYRSFGAGAEIAATISEAAFGALKAPVRRVATPDVPIPFSPPLEEELLVTPDRILQAALSLC